MVIGILSVLLIALGGGLLANRLKQPLITGYLIAAVIASFFGQHFFSNEASSFVSQIGTILVLFSIGLSFSFRRLSRVKSIAIWGAIVSIFVNFGVMFVLFYFGLKFPPPVSAVLAYAFSMASTAIVAKTLEQTGKTDTLLGEIVMGQMMLQDLAVVPFIVFLESFGASGAISGAVVSTIKSAFVLYLVLIFGRKLLPKIMDMAAKINNREIFSLFIFCVIFASAILAQLGGLSLATGAFIAGIIIAESAQNHNVFAEIRPLGDLAAVLLFTAVGMSLNLTEISGWGQIFLAVFLIVLIKILVGLVVTKQFRYHLKTAFEVSFAVSGIGEFALIIGLTAVNKGILSVDNYNFLAAVTIISLIISPFILTGGLPLFEKLDRLAAKWSPRLHKALFADFDHYRKGRSDINLKNHVVICGHGRVGRQIARSLALAGVPYVVIDANNRVTSELAASGVETVVGDPTEKEVLIFGKVADAASVVVAVPDKHSQELIISAVQTIHPGIPIICRSHFDEDRAHLYALGANYVVQPEMEAGLTMAHKILDVLGFEKNTINGYIRQVRKEQER